METGEEGVLEESFEISSAEVCKFSVDHYSYKAIHLENYWSTLVYSYISIKISHYLLPN